MKNKQRILTLTALACGTMLLSGCLVVDEENPADEITPPLSNTDEVNKQLRMAGSDTEFEQYLKQAMLTNNQAPSEKINDAEMLETTAMASPPMAASADSGRSTATSSTNTIVAGVDEADRIKVFGDYLYTALLPEPSVIDGVASKTNKIRISKLQADPAASEHLGSISTPGIGYNLSRLYLLPNDEKEPAVLANVMQQSNYNGVWFQPWSWVQGRTSIYLHDLTDPAAPRASGKISLDGQVIDSRRIGDELYLVTRFTPNVPHYSPFPASAKQKQANQELLKTEVSLTDLLPNITINDQASQPLFKPSRCFVPDNSWQASYSPAITSITRINLRDPKQFSTACFAGQVDGVYATPNNIYLTKQVYQRWGWGWPEIGIAIEAIEPSEPLPVSGQIGDQPEIKVAVNERLSLAPRPLPKPETIIHKFSLGTERISYRGSGSVPGNFDGGDAAFRLGEQGKYTYAITTLQGKQGPKHYFSTLAETRTGTGLGVVAQLPNAEQPRQIGKPNERLYATRFMGERAYLITYERIDPLYVVDLSQADQPQLRGELEVPGFSDYLHPISRDLLLGIGRHTTEANWVGGVKLSLFDVSNMDRPSEIKSLVIGGSGSYSPALNDHHAVAHLAPGDHSKSHRIAIPINVNKQNDINNRWDYNWLHSGLYLFEIDDAQTTRKPDLRHHGVVIGEENIGGSNNWPRRSIHQDRSVLQGGAVHYIHHNQLISTDWSAALAGPVVTPGPKPEPKPIPAQLTSTFSVSDALGNERSDFKVGDEVHINLTLRNDTNQAITYQTTAPGHSIAITNKDGAVWNKFYGISFTQNIVERTIEAQSSLSLGAVWTGINNEDTTVSAGEYLIETHVDASIDGQQLPAKDAIAITLH